MGGGAICEDVIRMGVPVDPFTFTEGSKNELINNLIVRMENHEISYPPIPELIHELEAYSYNITETGRTRRGAPSGFHDDCVDSLALATLRIGRHIDIGDVELLGDLESVGMFDDTEHLSSIERW